MRDESQKRRRTKKNKKQKLREALAFATGVTEMLSVYITQLLKV